MLYIITTYISINTRRKIELDILIIMEYRQPKRYTTRIR